MRIAILTSGRFHVCDLARELDALGHDVAFYSYVPKSRTRKFGLPDRSNRCLLPFVAPLIAARRLTRSSAIQSLLDHQIKRVLDHVAARLIRRCDVFISISGLALVSAETIRRKTGAKIWVHRGSRHILSQKEILNAIPNSNGKALTVPDWAVRRELASYELADTIVIQSLHVERSFLQNGVGPEKLFRNPNGVDLEMFSPTVSPSPDPRTIITAGAWSLRKGCDVLADAWRQLKGVRMIHIGPILDAPLPTEEGFIHHPPVDQSELRDFYAKGHVFVLASREEGLANVQLQALACGLPLVCTDRTGGEDLKALLRDPTVITVVPPDDPQSLAQGLQRSLDRVRGTNGVRNILGPDRGKFSWRQYGKRYNQALRERV